MPMFVPNYDCLSIHRLMLRDEVRMSRYREAIDALVNPGSSVLDLGSGLGVLGLMASRAGAHQVTFVERAAILSLAREIAADNRGKTNFKFFGGDSRQLKTDEKYDVIVSEWMGVHVFQENMIETVIDAGRRFLRPGGVMLPKGIALWLAPLIANPVEEREFNYWRTEVEKLDLSRLAEASCNEFYVTEIRPSNILGQGKIAFDIDIAAFELADCYHLESCFVAEREHEVKGICGWFQARLTDSIVLDTSPFAPPTHWQQTVYPFRSPVKVPAGAVLCLEIDVIPGDGYADFTWRGFIERDGETTGVEQSTFKQPCIPRNLEK